MRTKVYKNYQLVGEGELTESEGFGLQPEDTIVLGFVGTEPLEVRWKVFRFTNGKGYQPDLDLFVTEAADFRLGSAIDRKKEK